MRLQSWHDLVTEQQQEQITKHLSSFNTLLLMQSEKDTLA